LPNPCHYQDYDWSMSPLSLVPRETLLDTKGDLHLLIPRYTCTKMIDRVAMLLGLTVKAKARKRVFVFPGRSNCRKHDE